ncbi:MAG: YhdH/YhfP family quinone oxidoreductase [Desulfobacteraceae bacterium]|nr:YhdH/YhfP family quinone oxidoreductase [Desulfobacteraceae bacterium]
MTADSFRCLIVFEKKADVFDRQITTKTLSDLPDGDVLVKVHYSSLNYKDALSATGNKGVTRKYPHTPGIDASGEIVESKDRRFKTGENVLVTGYDLGMNTSGGFGQYIRVPANWIVALPENLSLKESMIFGTAGFTAALCIQKLELVGVTPEKGDILVTGASGGVGSISVAILAHMGFSVTAITGKPDANIFLKNLGAKKIISRKEFLDLSSKPLLPQRWAGVIDTVGANMLSTALRSTHRHGAVACCGNVAGAQLDITIYPFILRGISLFGADSATSAMETRKILWKKLSNEWKFAALDQISRQIGFNELNQEIDNVLSGGQIGRCVLNLDK